MRISTGSLLQFTLEFKIPINTNFNKITILDSLTSGLGYKVGTAKVYLNNNSTPEPISFGYVVDNSTTSTVSLTLGQNIVNPQSITICKIEIPVRVTNGETFIKTIQAGDISTNPPSQLYNIATINALAYDDTLLSSVIAKAPLDFKGCTLFGFGSSYTVLKTPGKEVYLIGNIPCIGSLETSELEYELIISVSDFLEVPSHFHTDEALVFLGDEKQTPLTAFSAIPDPITQKITVKFNHLLMVRNTPVYFALKVFTKSNIQTLQDNTLTSSVSCTLYYSEVPGTRKAVCSSPDFDITILLTPPPPSIENGDQVIGG